MVLLTRTVQESFSKDYFKKAVDAVLKGSIFSNYKIYDKDKRFAIIEIPLNPTSGEMDYRDFLRLLTKVLDDFKKFTVSSSGAKTAEPKPPLSPPCTPIPTTSEEISSNNCPQIRLFPTQPHG